MEADPEAVKRAVRRLQILVLMFIPILLVGVCVAWVVRSLMGDPLSLSSSLPALLILLAIPAMTAYLVVPRFIKKTDVMIGGDFINAPRVATPRYTTTAKYKDMTAVKINVVNDHIAGATIAARGVVVCTGRIKDPGIVVRAIFERAPDNIRWRRARWPHRRLSREEVKAMIEKAQVPDINRLLPRSAHYAGADELFARSQPELLPDRKGLFGRLSGGGMGRGIDLVSPQIPTPLSHYVGLMFLQMFEDGPPNRVLRRSEPLPVVTFKTDTAEPPPLEDVLNHLKSGCRINPKNHSGSLDGTIYVGIQGVPCKVQCRFDDSSEVCCQLRLERTTEQELREAEQKR
ncbi:MAG: hypothetical protein M1376_17955 [Planctomycetes bacterium]|nr:hypothetical protein [Planctomycetota bacterium]